jgi:hypothetical protein
MTKEPLLTLLRGLAEVYDVEMAHVEADKALLKYVNDAEITEAFQNIRKWYA